MQHFVSFSFTLQHCLFGALLMVNTTQSKEKGDEGEGWRRGGRGAGGGQLRVVCIVASDGHQQPIDGPTPSLGPTGVPNHIPAVQSAGSHWLLFII